MLQLQKFKHDPRSSIGFELVFANTQTLVLFAISDPSFLKGFEFFKGSVMTYNFFSESLMLRVEFQTKTKIFNERFVFWRGADHTQNEFQVSKKLFLLRKETFMDFASTLFILLN